MRTAMKKILVLLLAAGMLMSTGGCQLRLEKVEQPRVVDRPDQLSTVEQKPADTDPTPEPQQPEAPVAPLDLTGRWKQVDGNSDTNYQFAVIEDGVISIYWAFDDGTVALYWAGSYVAPASDTDPYTWDSVNDTSRTGSAIFASSDATKTIRYSGGRLDYQATAMGATVTVYLERFSGELPQIPADPAPSAGRQENEGTLGDYYVKVTGSRIAKDYDGNDLLVLQYDFTNNGSDDANAMWTLGFQAFQNGIQIDSGFGDTVSDNRNKSIKPGVTISCEEAFVLTGNSPVEIEISELISLGNEMVVTTIDLVE